LGYLPKRKNHIPVLHRIGYAKTKKQQIARKAYAGAIKKQNVEWLGRGSMFLTILHL